MAASTFAEACSVLEEILRGETRANILDSICVGNLPAALGKLRTAMRAHTFNTRSGPVNLLKLVKTFDERTKQDGFTVLIDWDGKANRWVDEMIPVDVLDYFARGVDPIPIAEPQRISLSILLDFYFLYIIALLAMRVGDDGNAPENVDRVTRVLADLQGPFGSGQQNVDDTGALILVATAHFEPDAAAYERLIARIQSQWNETQQLQIALSHAAILGSHLRHGFQDLYVRDLGLMRDDNGPDYPCLCHALLILIRAYDRMHEQSIQGNERERVVEGILNGLTPDPRAFIGKPPGPLTNYVSEQRQFAALFLKHHRHLFEEFELHRPSKREYSPLAFCFNFPHNIVKGMVIDALFKSTPSAISFNQLLTGIPRSVNGREALVRTLMGYAQRVPDKI